MSHQHKTLEDTVYFWFGANDTSGSGNDGANATIDVRLAGADEAAAPVTSFSLTGPLTHGDYPPGCYEVGVDATAVNGFAAGETYAVFCTLLVDSQNPTGFLGSFALAPVIANVIEVGGDDQSATDLKDFADTGYDPVAHKVNGVKLADLLTAISANGITATSMAANSITSTVLANAAITAAKLGADAITADKIADNAIGADQIAANAITAAKIANAAIDFATFAADVKTGAGLKSNVESISNDAITAASIATGAIAADAVGATALDNIVISDLAAVPGSTAKIVDAISILFMALVNEHISNSGAGIQSIGQAAGGANIVGSATMTDTGAGGVFTRGKVTT